MALSGGIEIDVSFVKDIEAHFKAFPRAIEAAFPIALNETARLTLKVGGDAMRKQVNFPAGYFDEPERFFVKSFATDTNPASVVSARARGTSLYRFAVGAPTPESTRGVVDEFGGAVHVKGAKPGREKATGPGVTVQVKPGQSINIPSAFVVNFNGNMQVAIKLKKGQFPSGFKKREISAERLGRNADLYVLYGPSVDQVFKTVREDIAPELMDAAAREFRRQFFVRLGK